MAIAAVVLAAGEATRFGSPKQRLRSPRCSSGWAGPSSTRSSSSQGVRARASRWVASSARREVQGVVARSGSVASLRPGSARAGRRRCRRRARGRPGPRPRERRSRARRVARRGRRRRGLVQRCTRASARGRACGVGRRAGSRTTRATGAPRALRRPRGARRRRHACRPSAAARGLSTATRLRPGREAPRASP